MKTITSSELRFLLQGNSLNNKMLFGVLNNCIPQIHRIYSVDIEKGKRAFEAQYHRDIHTKYEFKELYKNKHRYHPEDTIYVLKDGSVIGFESMCCDINTKEADHSIVVALTQLMKRCRKKERQKEFEINLITRGNYGLELTSMEIKKTKLNIGLYYNDDFKALDQLICKRLNTKNDKGIILLHGLPGTGKTTYIRHLVGRVKKKILFLPPGIASHITDPDFVNILVENPNSIVIIEDAEHVIQDRSYTGTSGVSNLLNISDGLLSDFLNVQLLCTFNTHISRIDSALLRKGRLIARYEFGKLRIEKAQALSRYLGQNRPINQDMTLSEIYHPENQATVRNESAPIGFRLPDICHEASKELEVAE